MSALFESHFSLLQAALAAKNSRGHWSAYPENPSPRQYGETAAADGDAAFDGLLGEPFLLDQPSNGLQVGGEISPFGLELGITYPAAEPHQLIAASQIAGAAWARASLPTRTGIALEILARLNKASFVMAKAVQHTTGQPPMMAFQAGGPHAQDRGLEAVAYAYAELASLPGTALWEKPAGKTTLRLSKDFRIVPRGIGLVIGCATFPTWNSYAAIFADLVTGNTVIIKPHPAAILPLALTVRIGREVVAEFGFDPNILLLAPDSAAAPITKTLATDPAIGLIDFTGSPQFGRWLRETIFHAPVFTEEAGVNPIVIDSTSDFKAMCQNIAFSLSLYSGQMCTAPQNIFVPREGITTDQGHMTFDAVAAGIAGAVDALLSNPERAAAVLGAVQNPATIARVAAARGVGKIIRDSAPLPGSSARTATPLILAVSAADEAAYLHEHFGPISLVIATEGTTDSIARASGSAAAHGAITAALYSTDEAIIEAATDAFAGAFVALSINLTGGIFVNQSAAFSDYHVSGGNPAGNACLTDAAYVVNRFRVVGIRRVAAA
jgi:phenylacetic acid degradation protein paaN